MSGFPIASYCLPQVGLSCAQRAPKYLRNKLQDDGVIGQLLQVKPHITVSKFQVGYTKSPIGGSGPCQCGYSAPRQIQTAIFDEHTRQYSCGSAHLNMWSLPIHTCHFGCSGHHYRLPDCPTNVREGLSGCTPLMAYGETGAGTEVYRAEGSEAQKLRGFVL